MAPQSAPQGPRHARHTPAFPCKRVLGKKTSSKAHTVAKLNPLHKSHPHLPACLLPWGTHHLQRLLCWG